MLINTDNQHDAQKLQLELRNFCRDVLPDLFNEVFDAVAPARTLRIKQIRLELGNIRAGHFIADIKEKIIAQLYQQLREYLHDIERSQTRSSCKDEAVSDNYHGPFSIDGQPGYTDSNNELSKYQALLHYIRYGLKPWWISGSAGFSPGNMLRDLFVSGHNLFVRLVVAAGPGTNERKRLMTLVSKTWFFEHYKHFRKSDSELVKAFVAKLDSNNYQKILQYWLSGIELEKEEKQATGFSIWILKCAKHCPAVQKKSIEIFKKLAMELKADSNKTRLSALSDQLFDQLLALQKGSDITSPKATGKSKRPDQQAKKAVLKAGESLAVENAGLVLVWPFLKSAFQKLDWLTENQFKDRQTVEKAIVWLHFLIHETMPEDESTLLLNKLLCGLGAEEALSLDDIRLRRKEISEAEEVKKAIIQNWPALKTTATSALKESFFKRNGLLKTKEDNWYLAIEKKGIDVLIDRLPWPIAHIKLPWNNYMIHVNW